jgi:hypothetical protein
MLKAAAASGLMPSSSSDDDSTYEECAGRTSAAAQPKSAASSSGDSSDDSVSEAQPAAKAQPAKNKATKKKTVHATDKQQPLKETRQPATPTPSCTKAWKGPELGNSSSSGGDDSDSDSSESEGEKERMRMIRDSGAVVDGSTVQVNKQKEAEALRMKKLTVRYPTLPSGDSAHRAALTRVWHAETAGGVTAARTAGNHCQPSWRCAGDQSILRGEGAAGLQPPVDRQPRRRALSFGARVPIPRSVGS